MPGGSARLVAILVSLVLSACSFSEETSTGEPPFETIEAPERQSVTEAPLDPFALAELTELNEFSEGYSVGSSAPVSDSMVSCAMTTNGSGGALAVSTVTNAGTEQARYSFEVSVFEGDRRVRRPQTLRIDYVDPGARGLETINFSDLAFTELLRCNAEAVFRSDYYETGPAYQDRLQFTPCMISLADDQPDAVEISFQVTNLTDKRLTYLLDVNIFAADRVGQTTLDFAREIGPGDSAPEALLWNHFDLDPATLSCETVGLQLFSSDAALSPGD